MNRSTRTRLGATAAAVTIAAGGFVLAGSSSSTAGGTPSWAYGLAIPGQVPATPYVESRDGQVHEKTAVPLPDNNPVVSGDVGRLSAGDGTASVTLTDLTVGQLGGQLEPPEQLVQGCQQLQDQLNAAANQGSGGEQNPLGEGVKQGREALGDATGGATDALPDDDATGGVTDALSDDDAPVPAPLQTLVDQIEGLSEGDLPNLCGALEDGGSLLGLELVEVSCEGSDGSVQVAGLTALGQQVPIPESPANTTIPLGPLGGITINKQTDESDGSFTVKAVEIDLAGMQTIDLGVAHCGDFQPDAKPKPRPAPEQAPAPEPVQDRLPVTG